MMTNSGRLVLPGGDDVPTLDDIALGLSRIPRFAGQTSELYTVAEHSLAAANLAADPDRWDRALPLHALLHDAHETASSDVPTTWKPTALSVWQDKFDRQLYRRYALPDPSPAAVIEVRAIDRALLLAEAKLFHPRAYIRLSEEMQLAASHEALAAVGYIRQLHDGDPARVRSGFRAQLERLISRWEGMP